MHALTLSGKRLHFLPKQSRKDLQIMDMRGLRCIIDWHIILWVVKLIEVLILKHSNLENSRYSNEFQHGWMKSKRKKRPVLRHELIKNTQELKPDHLRQSTNQRVTEKIPDSYWAVHGHNDEREWLFTILLISKQNPGCELLCVYWELNLNSLHEQ